MSSIEIEELLTTTAAAAAVGVSQSAVRVAINEGRLTGSKAGGVWYVTRSDLLAWDRATKRPVFTRVPVWEHSAAILAEYGSLSAEELAVLADIHVGNARKHLAILAKQGRAERRPDGQWVLIAQEHQGAA